MIRRALGLGIGMWLSVCAAHAQEAAPARDAAAERAMPESTPPSVLHERATTAFDNEEYELALGLFQLLVELTGNMVEQFNAAACLEQLGRFREAFEGYTTVSEDESTSDAYRALARNAVTRVREHVGVLRMTGPSGAIARIDGDRSCTLPCELIVDPGSHRARIDEPFVDEHTVLTIGGASRSVRFAPPPPGASFSWLSVLGATFMAAGGAGILGFGITTQDLEATFQRQPSVSLAQEGSLMRDLTNGSIAVAATGGLLFMIDVILFATFAPPEGSRDE